MSEMIAFCGLNCSQCPSYLATRADDDAAREKTSRWLSKNYGLHIRPREINCDGCRIRGGRRLSYCSRCPVRKCALDRGVETCAKCPEQPCEALSEFHTYSPEAKAGFQNLLPRD